MEDQFRPDVMLLAAGLGMRLRPLTDALAKPLVRVGGNALIGRIGTAEAEGLMRFVANVHHLAELVVAHLARRTRVTLAEAEAALR